MEKISVGSTLCGLLVGTLVLCANFQFGLQTGWVSMMSMPAALLGFAWFKTIRSALTPQENVYIQSVAVAVGTGPLSFGLVGAVPAIQLLLTEDEGRTSFTYFQLVAWSLGIAYMGIFTAVLLREAIIRDKQLRFPSGSAAAALIGVLHDKPVLVETPLENVGDSDDEDVVEAEGAGTGSDELSASTGAPGRSGRCNTSVSEQRPDVSMMLNSRDGRNKTYRKNIVVLALMFVLSSIYTIINKTFSIVKDAPIFGRKAAFYMWQLDLSPAYIGQGIIMGLPTTASMLLGAVLGWGVLVPLSDSMKWATGPIDDWQTGAQGWIMWVSLAIMVADTTVSFGILTLNTSLHFVQSRIRSKDSFGAYEQAVPLNENQYSGQRADLDSVEPTPDLVPAVIEHPRDQLKVAAVGLTASSLLCIACIKLLFKGVPFLALAVAVALSPMLSLLGVRALGETDLNPVSSIAKLTQFVFGVMMRHKPQAILLNIVAGAITEAGAQQAGDLMQDYKTGSLLGALMTNQTFGMIIGTTWSVLISGLVYNLYTTRFEIPGKEFRIPTAYIWADCARLMTGQGLPDKAGIFSLSLGILFAILAIVKHVYRERSWATWVPSGVAVGIGMYNVPSFTIARFIGGLSAWVYSKRYSNPADEVYLVILSSGLILGEGLMSVVYLVATL